jgi:hypothetical protein
MAAEEQATEGLHKRTLRQLILGREVPLEKARDAIDWLRADATVMETSNGKVRLRVPVHPRSATDMRAGGARA